MRKLSQITESVWSDIHRRSNGEQMRKEDKIPFSSLDDGNISNLFTYITQNYKSIDKKYDMYCVDGNIIIPITSDYSTLKTETQYYPFDNGNELEFAVVSDDLVDKIDSDLYDYTEKDPGMKNETKIIIDDDFMPKSRFVQILDSILENVPNPVLKKIGDIKESVWTDIHKRSNGTKERREDDINLMDQDDLTEYLKSRYEPVPGSRWKDIIDTESKDDKIYVTVLEPDIESYAYNVSLIFPKGRGNHKNITMSYDLMQDCPEVYKLLKDNYILSNYSSHMFSISPSDKSEVTNKFFVDIIDFLIDNIPDNKLLIKRK